LGGREGIFRKGSESFGGSPVDILSNNSEETSIICTIKGKVVI